MYIGLIIGLKAIFASINGLVAVDLKLKELEFFIKQVEHSKQAKPLDNLFNLTIFSIQLIFFLNSRLE